MEARERGARTKAETLLHEFSGVFSEIGYTLHPGGIIGEAAGKSSNLSWAVRQGWYTVAERGPKAEARTVVTVLDSDSEYSVTNSERPPSRVRKPRAVVCVADWST
jgi:hypothetical protein